jgi:hypothetical protein
MNGALQTSNGKNDIPGFLKELPGDHESIIKFIRNNINPFAGTCVMREQGGIHLYGQLIF